MAQKSIKSKAQPKKSATDFKTSAKTNRVNPILTAASQTDSPYPEFDSLTQLVLLTEHWQSDLKFYEDEIRFLHNLIVRYFMWLSDERNLTRTRAIAKELTQLDIQRKVIEKEIALHLQDSSELVKNPFSHDSHKFKNEQVRLEKEIADFTKAFRAIKKNAFELTEEVIESEKVKHLIGKT